LVFSGYQFAASFSNWSKQLRRTGPAAGDAQNLSDTRTYLAGVGGRGLAAKNI